MREKGSTFTYISIAAVVLAFVALSGFTDTSPQWIIHNPYRQVDWDHHGQYKANFHTHTTRSDGSATPATVIDLYAGLGYSILSLTDHDTVGPNGNRRHRRRHRTTWPWESFGRSPESVGMVAVEGNEISRVHHIGSYFNNYGDPRVASERAALREIGRRGGLAVFFHPGRYRMPADWYVDMFRLYPYLIGLEIYNKGDYYPGDRNTWDAVLEKMAEERSVWGFSNDDMHRPAVQLGRNWNVMVLPELSSDAVRRAMENGAFFYVYVRDGHRGEEPPPRIRRIGVDECRGIISIDAVGHERIEWISRGVIVHAGDSCDLSGTDGITGYVRAVVHGAGDASLIGTQPFRVRLRGE